MKIKIGKGYNKGKSFDNKIITAENGRFVKIEDGGDYDLDLTAYTVFPGFIDIHTHGGMGFDANTDDPKVFSTLSEYYAKNGVAEFCATTVTADIDDLVKTEKTVSECMKKGLDGASIAGMYLEGPFLSHEFKGAHEEDFLRLPKKEYIDKLIEAGNGNIRVISVAPELEGALDAIKYITSKGIKVSCGHSAATCDEANKGFDAGAGIAIHTYNAMKGLHHREPGFLGASLVRDDIYNEIICDFIHVKKEAIEIAIRCKGKDKIVYITDSIAPAGLPDGKYKSGPLDITVKDGVARTETGAIAGSSLATNKALGNVVKVIGIPVEDAMLGVTKNAAEAIGIYGEAGSIDEGKRAHLTVLDDDFNVVMTIVDGKIVYKA